MVASGRSRHRCRGCDVRGGTHRSARRGTRASFKRRSGSRGRQRSGSRGRRSGWRPVAHRGDAIRDGHFDARAVDHCREQLAGSARGRGAASRSVAGRCGHRAKSRRAAIRSRQRRGTRQPVRRAATQGHSSPSHRVRNQRDAAGSTTLMRIATALLALVVTATPAAAQSVRLTVDGADIADLARHVSRIVESSVATIGADLGDVFSDVGARTTAIAALESRRLQSRNFKAEQTDRETRTLSIGLSGTLDLDTLSGDIIVNAGSSRDVTLEIVRRSRGRTDADAKAGLDRVKVQVDSGPDRARVHTPSADMRNPPYSVDVSYTVTAPPGTRVTGHTVSGNVTVKGLRGDVDAGVTSGGITITGSRAVRARTVSGDVGLTDIDTDGTVDVGTVSGTM